MRRKRICKDFSAIAHLGANFGLVFVQSALEFSQTNLDMYDPVYIQQKCYISLNHKYLVLILQRVALFSAFATSAMCNAGFDVVDVYPISDASPDGILDNVHYNPRVFWDLEALLEKYKTKNNEKLDHNKWKNTLKRCIG